MAELSKLEFALFVSMGLLIGLGAGAGFTILSNHVFNTPEPCGTFQELGAETHYTFKGYFQITNGTYPNGTQWARVNC